MLLLPKHSHALPPNEVEVEAQGRALQVLNLHLFVPIANAARQRMFAYIYIYIYIYILEVFKRLLAIFACIRLCTLAATPCISTTDNV